MTRVRRPDDRPMRLAFGLTVAVFLALGGAAVLPAAEPQDAPPTLAVTPAEPLPEPLRKAVPESVEELRAIQDRVRSLVTELQAVTVGLRRGPAQGTGVIVSKDGFVLTAAHVSGPPGRRVRLIFNNGSVVDGVSLGRHEVLDAGLVKITESGDWPVAKIGDVDDLKHGDWVLGTGHPGGFDGERLPVVRIGKVIFKMNSVIQTDAALVGGDSGGPLFDLNGRVIGIHSRIGPGTEFNFHVPISAYAESWHWLTRSEERPLGPPPEGSPMLGVDGVDVRSGCRVTRVFEGSPADEAGLELGDVITRFDDRYVTSQEDLIAAVRHYRPGESVDVAIRRDGERQSVRVTLAKRPPPRQAARER